jgi:hypothetical protein
VATPMPHCQAESPSDVVLADLTGVLAKGVEYLDHFVNRARFAVDSVWQLEAIEFGRTGQEPVGEFEAFFSLTGDLYGLWSVVFRRDDRFRITGVGFSRRQR